MIKILSKLNFLINFIRFLFSQNIISFKDIFFLKRVGNGLSNTFILKNMYVVKIKNSIRENVNKKIYNGKFEGSFYYVEEKFSYEFNILYRLSKYNLSPKPLLKGKNFLIIEYIDGNTLSEYLLKTKNYEILKKVFIEINRMHDLGIFHGDLNLDNIIVTKNKEIKFIDFESQLLECIDRNKKKEIELKIMLEKTKRFYPELYKYVEEYISKYY